MANAEEFSETVEENAKTEDNNSGSSENTQEKVRVRLPKEGEVIGIIEQRLGGNKIMVNCLDGKTRNCRVPGRLKRKLWLRPNDVVIVELWELDKNRGDVIFKYRPTEVEWLRKNGYLEKEVTEF